MPTERSLPLKAQSHLPRVLSEQHLPRCTRVRLPCAITDRPSPLPAPTFVPWALIGVLLMVPLAQGCSSLGAQEAETNAGSAGSLPRSSGALPPDEERSQAEQNLILSEGYSQLYEAAGSLQYLDEALLLKVESDEVEKFAQDASSTFKKLGERLAKLGENYPGIALDNSGLPVLERKKRDAAAADRLKSFAPVTGLSGIEFERTLLLTLSGGLNQLEFLAKVMQEEEKDDERIRLLKDIETDVRRLYEADLALLKRDYFVTE